MLEEKKSKELLGKESKLKSADTRFIHYGCSSQEGEGKREREGERKRRVKEREKGWKG